MVKDGEGADRLIWFSWQPQTNMHREATDAVRRNEEVVYFTKIPPFATWRLQP